MSVVDLKELMIQKIIDTDPNIDVSDSSMASEIGVRPFSAFLQSLELLFARDEIVRDLRRFNEMTDAELEALAANFDVTRKEGTNSSGVVTIFLANPRDITIPIGQRFTSNTGFVFLSAETVFRTRNQMAQAFDRTKNAYKLDVKVESSGTGASFNIAIGDIVQMVGQPEDVIIVTNFSEFTKSTARETNEELASRIISSASMRNLVSADSTEVLLKSDTRVKEAKAIGAGDIEMTRDIVYGIHTNGLQDIYIYQADQIPVYVRDLPITSLTFPTFIFLGPDLNGFLLDSELPDFNVDTAGPVIFIKSVEWGTGIGTTFSSRGVLKLGEDYVHEFLSGFDKETKNSVEEAWSLRIVKFPDPSCQTIRVTAFRSPLVGSLQAEFKDSGSRAPAQSALFKSFIPVLLNVSATVRPRIGASRDSSTYVNAILATIAADPVAATVDASDFIAALQNAGADRVELPIQLSAKALYPDLSESVAVFDESVTLVVLERPEANATIRTMAVYANDIVVHVI